jgi:hypothetical protein
VIVVTLPIKAESVANLREGWRKKAARTKLHRTTAWAMLRAADKEPRLLGPVTVTLTRIAPRPLDGDNNQSALKAARDGVADWLGVPDNDPRITWVYAQSKGAPKTYAVRVEVSS